MKNRPFLFSSGNSFCIVTGSPAKIPETIEKLGLTPVVTLKIQRLFRYFILGSALRLKKRAMYLGGCTILYRGFKVFKNYLSIIITILIYFFFFFRTNRQCSIVLTTKWWIICNPMHVVPITWIGTIGHVF